MVKRTRAGKTPAQIQRMVTDGDIAAIREYVDYGEGGRGVYGPHGNTWVDYRNEYVPGVGKACFAVLSIQGRERVRVALNGPTSGEVEIVGSEAADAARDDLRAHRRAAEAAYAASHAALVDDIERYLPEYAAPGAEVPGWEFIPGQLGGIYTRGERGECVSARGAFRSAAIRRSVIERDEAGVWESTRDEAGVWESTFDRALYGARF